MPGTVRIPFGFSLPGVLLLSVSMAAASPESDCFLGSLPPVAVKDSAERRRAVDACTELIVADPTDPRPYFHRGEARYVGPPPLLGWNEAPLFDIRVADDPDPVIADYQEALARADGKRKLRQDGVAWLRLGYLHAQKGAWQDAVRAWRKAEGFEETARPARPRLFFGQGRLVAPDRLVAEPPGTCEELGFWDCAFVSGCTLLLTPGHERAYKGCEGKPRGLEPGLRPAELDCGLLDENFCEQTHRCRWRESRLRRDACVAK